ncbi:MAG: OmpA family protein [Roseivivax sp.]|nr:OmpA family protein [Roseivivax sp.]
MTALPRITRVAGAALVLSWIALGAVAQSGNSLSKQEIAERLLKQKTRGLVMVPVTQPAATEAAAQTAAAPEPAPAAPAQNTVTAVTAYQEVAKEDQINLQISFDFDSAALRDDQKPVLAAMCEVMQSVDVAVFQIIGHTDAAGSASYNQNLSLLRAQEVKRFLTDDCGIDAVRLQAVGMGESAPFNEANPRADENRRVEFQALG